MAARAGLPRHTFPICARRDSFWQTCHYSQVVFFSLLNLHFANCAGDVTSLAPPAWVLVRIRWPEVRGDILGYVVWGAPGAPGGAWGVLGGARSKDRPGRYKGPEPKRSSSTLDPTTLRREDINLGALKRRARYVRHSIGPSEAAWRGRVAWRQPSGSRYTVTPLD